jgi:hypothetical protein
MRDVDWPRRRHIIYPGHPLHGLGGSLIHGNQALLGVVHADGVRVPLLLRKHLALEQEGTPTGGVSVLGVHR